MTNDDSWEELAWQFEDLDLDGSLVLIWNYDRAKKKYTFGYAWSQASAFIHAADPHRNSESHKELVTAKFRAYGTRAGKKMAIPGDPFYWWLVEVKLRGQNDAPNEGVEFNPATGGERRVTQGRVNDVCKMAAALCYSLEANPRPYVRMLQIESIKDAPLSLAPLTPAPEAKQPHTPTDKRDPLRVKLLSEYGAATGSPSNRKIYTARNSGINKPEFYAWLRGDLPEKSKTTIKFEKFLRAKKYPIPKASQ